MDKNNKIFDIIIINDDNEFNDTFLRAVPFINQMEHRIDIKNYEQFKELFDIVYDNFCFRLWIHLGMLNKTDPKTYKATLIKQSISGNRILKNLQYQFITREDKLKVKDYENIPIISLERSVAEAFKIEDFPVNKKLKLIESYAERNAQTNEAYIGGDPFSAIEKAKAVLRILEENHINLNGYAFVNLGGGDGTELFYEIERSAANIGCLIEYDASSIDRFNILEKQFQTHLGTRVIKFFPRECDLFDNNKFDKLKRFIQDEKLNGIVITIHAVLHELKTRSKLRDKFDLQEFFDRISELHNNIILIIREPGIAENWPEKVRIIINNKKVLYKKCKFVKRNLDKLNDNVKIFNKVLEILKTKYFPKADYDYDPKKDEFTVSKNLAIEGLTKFFYLPDFYYEIEEQQTSISRGKIQHTLGKSGFKIIESEAISTNSIKNKFKEFQIKVYDEENRLLPRPLCFSYTIAFISDHKHTRKIN